MPANTTEIEKRLWEAADDLRANSKLKPYHGRILDPFSASGGMFVQSAAFLERHKQNPGAVIALYGQEKVAETVRLCRMNLAVHGLSGEIKQANTFYDDAHSSVGRFDFVMANSASDARGSELDVRMKLIEAGAVDVMLAVGPNMFYTVTLPCTLWFLDRGKALTPGPSPVREKQRTGEGRKNTVLFIDARHIYRQIDRAHREFTDEQIAFIASLVRLYRGEDLNGYTFDPAGFNLSDSQISKLKSAIKNLKYVDVPGLCKVATLKDIEAQGWSLNPGRYVGVAEREADDFDFAEKLEELNEELETLNAEARELEDRIGENVATVLQELYE